MSLSRRGLLQAGALGSVGLSLPRGVRAEGPRGPNVVILLSDQHTHRAMGLHGHRSARTPNLDRLAEMGVSYERSYCADPSCVPARTSLFTGRPSSEHGALINPMEVRPDLPDLGQWLREHSAHRPVYMGKWHIPGRNVANSFDLLAYTSSAGEHSDASLVRAFEGFLQNTAPDAPFVLVLSLYNPHDIVHLVDIGNTWGEPGDLDLADLEDLDDDELGLPGLPPNFAVPEREPALFTAVKRTNGREDRWSEGKWRTYRWWYDRQVEALDALVGRVTDLVRNSDHADNTVLLYTSDHGDAQGEHRLINKQSLYEAAVKVPLVAAWPGRFPARGVDRDQLVSGLDLFPTVCELVGAPAPDGLRGVSLVSALQGDPTPVRDHLQVQSLVEGRLIATAEHTWVGFRDDPTEQLFDIRADPFQTRDLSQDPAYQGLLAEHRALQEAFEARLDPVPLALQPYDASLEVVGKPPISRTPS